MSSKFIPKGHWFTTTEDESALPGSHYDNARDDDLFGEPALASGWWILPFALGGLFECYFAVEWIFAHL